MTKYSYFSISAISLQVGRIAVIAASSIYILVNPKTVNTSINSIAIAAEPDAATVIYVNPETGIDNGNTGTTPYKTISYALNQVKSDTVIQLAPGTYSKESGEIFPLVLKPGVTLRGDTSTRGQGILINGGGDYMSRFFAKQSTSIITDDKTVITGVTVTNPNQRGTGVWVESTNPIIANNTFIKSLREGVFVTGTGNPQIINNTFQDNAANGISITNSAQGEIRNNLFQHTGFGLAIGGESKPLVTDNTIIQNQDGIFISEAAKPVLRKNLIKNNRRDGIVVTINALPDIGNNGDLGQNVIHDNGLYDFDDSTQKHKVVSIGNDIGKVRGSKQNVSKSVTTKQSSSKQKISKSITTKHKGVKAKKKPHFQ